MNKLEKLALFLLFSGVILCIISIFTPAAFFENRAWDHTIIYWLWGFKYEKFVHYHDERDFIINTFFSHPLQLVPSIISTGLIVVSLVFIVKSMYGYRKNIINNLRMKKQTLGPIIILILSIITWIVMMEVAELFIYDVSMWNRYIPSFGVIGMFLGAGLIICGFFVIKKVRLNYPTKKSG